MEKLLDTIKFRLERFVLSGTPGRLVLMAAAIALMSTAAGLAALWADPSLRTPGDAIWWAFLRLTDPGYLGDDHGRLKRLISTTLTILGLAIFVGGLVAIVTQWLNETVRKLERGLTPVSQEDHVVILGWTDRTIGIVSELMRSQERVRRFLRLVDRRRLSIVVLARELDAGRIHEFRTLMGEDWDRASITLRSGTPLRLEHLERVDFLRAAVVVLPGADFGQGGAEAVDTRTIKTILAIDNAARDVADEELPLLIAEIYDYRKLALARRAYRGRIELLASDRVTASLIAQNTRHRNLSYIYRDLLDQEGNELYVRRCPELDGELFHACLDAFTEAIPIGVARFEGRQWSAHLCPAMDYVLTERDHVVVISETFEASAPVHAAALTAPPEEVLRYEEDAPPLIRVLVLGWGHMIAAMLEEFDASERQHHEVHVLSLVPIEQRERQMRGYELDLQRVDVRHFEGDYTLFADLQRVAPASFDHVIMLANDWVPNSEESDARTIVGFLLLEQLLADTPRRERPELLVELTDEDNEELLRAPRAEILVSATLEGHMLAQITLRSELRAVFEALFGSSMPMFDFRPAHTYEGVIGEERSFKELQHMARAYGEILIGVRVDPVEGEARERDGGVLLNPSHESTWRLRHRDDLIVLVNH